MRLFLFFAARTIPAFIITFVVFSILRVKFFSHRKINSNGFREFLLSIFAGYIAFLAIMLFMPNSYISDSGINLTNEHFDFVGNFKDRITSGAWGVNLVPFRTIKNYIKYSGFLHTMTNIIGNIIIFVPFGILLPEIFPKTRSLLKILGITSVTSFFVEFIQFFIGRSVDIDDLILNVLGSAIGYFMWKEILRFKFAKKKRRKKTRRTEIR
ncbi:VanZ family protein [Peptoniphilus sp. AGMB00490]|uniref:VanZ family protein n=2 Tax=Peptoniphilus TaxID=162289 RepID=A0ACD6AZS0_9FIRM|nr:VanZ family protein [Peptoniphilus porci]NMW85362.1 VanZ family protein [Peptoniphilus faecalis]OLR65216.1 teicoplanin resistance protein VanZ [Peptoniphilus porci]